jgi:predicted aspartyl protease
MRKTLFVTALAMVLYAPGAAQADDEKCTLSRYATLPITIDEYGGATVPIKIDGQVQHLLIDTAGVYSMLTEGAAAKLQLKPKMMTDSLTLFGGRRLDHYVATHSIEIAGMQLENREFALLPDDALPSADDGILAPNFLRYFDVDFDFAAGQVNLFSHEHCEGKVVYWTHEPQARIPFEMDESDHIKVPVMLDGKKVIATIDTGATLSVMSMEWAGKLFDVDEEAVKNNKGRYPFKTLTLEGVVISNPDIRLIPNDKTKVMGLGQTKMILGMGVLRQLHVYIAYKEHNIYVTAATAH